MTQSSPFSLPKPLWPWAALFFAAWAFGLAMIPFRRAGGDSVEMAGYVSSPYGCYYFRSPLTVAMHRAAFRAIRPFGFSGADAMALCSAAAGGVFLLALLSISRHPLFLAFNLVSGTVFLFFGHVENYAWVNAMLVVFLALLKRHLEAAWPVWPAAAALTLACLLHMLAVFTLPVLAFAIWGWNAQRKRIVRRIEDGDFEWVLIWLVGAAMIVALGPLVFPAAGLDNNFQRLTPLPPNPDPMHYYFTLFSPDHLKMIAYFHWKATPLGLAVLAALGWKIRTRFERYALGATLCSLAWTSVWHPDMGKPDWDLFCSFGFPLNVLDGLLLARIWTEFRAKKGELQPLSKNSDTGKIIP